MEMDRCLKIFIRKLCELYDKEKSKKAMSKPEFLNLKKVMKKIIAIVKKSPDMDSSANSIINELEIYLQDRIQVCDKKRLIKVVDRTRSNEKRYKESKRMVVKLMDIIQTMRRDVSKMEDLFGTF